MKKLSLSVHRVLSSPWMWRLILGGFIFASVWIALSSRYPMAFDEDFHLGVIKLYATHWLPFLSHLPSSDAAYGAIGQDPSYLYHYLMSFPYRLLASFIRDQTTIVIVLRLINVGLVVAALVLFRKALRRAGLGNGSANVLIAIFTLLPISPLLAGQISYDNLLLLLLACLALQIQPLIAAINKRQLPAETILITLVICLMASIVKYSFLPIFIATLIFISTLIVYRFRHSGKTILPLLRTAWQKISIPRRSILIGAIAVLLVLTGQRYVVNTITYHSPIPDCSKVYDEASCSQYGPWNRDHLLTAAKKAQNIKVNPNPFVYGWNWLYGMWYRLFFMVTSYDNFQNFAPLPIVGVGGAILFVAAVAMFAATYRRVMKDRPVFLYFIVISASYVIALWLQNYLAYLRTGQPVAINGRYLLPLLLLAGAPIITGVSLFVRNRTMLRGALIIAAMIIFLEGGGLSSFIIRSNENWYWDSTFIHLMNDATRSIIKPVIFGSEYTLEIPDP